MQVIVGKDLIILLISNIIILHKKGITNVELVKIDVKGLENTYAVSVFEKEFLKAVNEPWLDEEPFKRYQKKLIEDLTVLEMEKEKAIDMPQYEKITGEMDLYSIRHPESRKNIRVIYTIYEEAIIILTAFLEKNSGDYRKAIRLAKRRLKELDKD